MKIQSMLLTLSCLVFANSFSIASEGGVGNGGDGVYINNKLYLLDLVEAGIQQKPKYGTAIRTDILKRVEGILNPQEFPTKVIAAKLTEYHPNVRVIERHLQLIENLKWNFSDAPLVNVKDENSVLRPNFVQLAIRRKDRVRIDRKLWEQLDEANRAALIFHEIYYTYAQIKQGQKVIGKTTVKYSYQDSNYARENVGEVFSRIRSKSPELEARRTKEGFTAFGRGVQVLNKSNNWQRVSILFDQRPGNFELAQLERLCQTDALQPVQLKFVEDAYLFNIVTTRYFTVDGVAQVRMNDDLGDYSGAELDRVISYSSPIECLENVQSDLEVYSTNLKSLYDNHKYQF